MVLSVQRAFLLVTFHVHLVSLCTKPDLRIVIVAMDPSSKLKMYPLKYFLISSSSQWLFETVWIDIHIRVAFPIFLELISILIPLEL